MRIHAARVAIALCTAAGPASAQARCTPAPGPAFALFRSAPKAAPTPSTLAVAARTPDYRWEGLAIGAIGLGAFSAYGANWWCHDSDSNTSGKNCLLATLFGALAGATVGGVTGGLIGGLIPKPR